MPNSRRTEIIRFHDQAVGSLDRAGQHFASALQVVESFIEEFTTAGKDISDQHLALQQGFNLLIDMTAEVYSLATEMKEIL